MTKREAIERTQFEDTICAESSLPYSEARHRARLLCRHGKTYSRLQEAN